VTCGTGLKSRVIPCGGDIQQCTRRLFFSEAFGRKRGMLKLQAISHDGSVGLEFMTDNPAEAEEMREQWLEFDCVKGGLGIGRAGMGQPVVCGLR
jgi:hypothetical protein